MTDTTGLQAASGGAFIAVVGGDGSGKSTAVEHLKKCLADRYETACIHLGKPPWSWATRLVRSGIMFCRWLRFYDEDRLAVDVLDANSTSVYPVLLRAVCKARDRYRVYRKVRQQVARGQVVICDRFPVPYITLMDGPNAERFMQGKPANRLTRLLTKWEQSYYQRIEMPDLLFVLCLNPDTAVKRKVSEDSNAVRTRNQEIWHRDWSTTEAYVIDAERPRDEVLAAMEQIVYQNVSI